MNPHQVTADFEDAVARYAGAPYAVSTTSCTMAIFLSLQWLKSCGKLPHVVECPTRTYVSVPMQIVHAGSKIAFRVEHWFHRGWYRLGGTPVIDSARLFTSGMYWPGTLWCTSHHWGKTLSLQQAGCILTDDPEAVQWLRRARFDGRTPGVKPKDDDFILGYHAYLSPEVAALGLMKLSLLPRDNAPLAADDYPDLSKAAVFAPHLAPANQVDWPHENSRDHSGETRIVTSPG